MLTVRTRCEWCAGTTRHSSSYPFPKMIKQFQRWGTGCGIEIDGTALRVVAVRSRASSLTLLGELTIEDFRARAAEDWGREYSDFLKSHGISHVAATVCLPREEVIVRQIQLPPMSPKERPAAVRYQLDGLHPFAEDEVCHAFAPLTPEKHSGPLSLAVLIAEKETVDSHADLFERAGVAIAAFTVSSAALYAALRVRWEKPPRPFLLADFREDTVEIYGESEQRPLLSVEFNLRTVPAQRAVQLATADLRLADDEGATFVAAGSISCGEDEEAERFEPLAAFEVKSAAELFPEPLADSATFDLKHGLSALATALESACPGLGLQANLLPAERRQSDSRLLWLPTTALVALLVLLGIGFLVRPLLQDGAYAATLESRIDSLEAVAANADGDRASTAQVRAKLSVLERLERRTETDLRIVSEISDLLPIEASLTSLEISDEGVRLLGDAKSAAPLLAVLNQAQSISKAAFTTSLVKTEEGERFQITAARAALGDPRPAPAPTAVEAPAPAPPATEPTEPASGTLTTLGGAGS